jgi:hypothetical protein
MRSSLLVVALAWMLLFPVPAFSQPSQDGPSGAQYDQYGGPVPGVGGRAMQDAIVASDAIRDSAEEAQAAGEGAVSAAETQDESSPELEKLPDTGGPSPLWLGAAPLLGAGSLLARRIMF